MRPPRIATIGLASWDLLLSVDRYPEPGAGAIVEQLSEQPGGTTANSAIALAKLGASVSFTGMIGDDANGEKLRGALEQAGVDLTWLRVREGERTDLAIVIVSREPVERTIYWPPGAHIVKGDQIDIPWLFGHDLVVLDTDDMPLRRFLSDLPAHTLPATRLLGTLVYASDLAIPDRLDVMLRHDAVVGNASELMRVAGVTDFETAVTIVQSRMVGSNLRAGVISRGERGAIAFTATERWAVDAYPIEVVDTTGAGDAFTAGVAFGMALRWPWERTLRLANACGGLACRALGAQASLPDWNEIAAITGEPVESWLS
jgi:sugar/nucleoside kinase (ribokinase family)